MSLLSGDSRRPLGPASCHLCGLLIPLKSPGHPGGVREEREPTAPRQGAIMPGPQGEAETGELLGTKATASRHLL